MQESNENRYQNQCRVVKAYRWLLWKPWYALTALYRFTLGSGSPVFEDDTRWLSLKSIWSIHMGLADIKMNHLYDDAELNWKSP